MARQQDLMEGMVARRRSLISCNPSWLTQAPWKTLLLGKPYSTFPPGASQQTAGQEEGGASVCLGLLQGERTQFELPVSEAYMDTF